MDQMNLPGLRIIIKMSSVKPFTLNASMKNLGHVPRRSAGHLNITKRSPIL